MLYGLIIRVRINGKIKKYVALNEYGNNVQMAHSELMKHVRKGEFVNLAPSGDLFTGKGVYVSQIPLFDENMMQVSGIQYDTYFNTLAYRIQQELNNRQNKKYEEQQKKDEKAYNEEFKKQEKKQIRLDKMADKVLKSDIAKEANKRINREKYMKHIDNVEKYVQFINHIGEQVVKAKANTNAKLRSSKATQYTRSLDATTSDSKINEFILRYGVMEVRSRIVAFYNQAKQIIDNELTESDKRYYLDEIDRAKFYVAKIQELHKTTRDILKTNSGEIIDEQNQAKEEKKQVKEDYKQQVEQQKEEDKQLKGMVDSFVDRVEKIIDKVSSLDININKADKIRSMIDSLEENIVTVNNEVNALGSQFVSDKVLPHISTAMTLLSDKEDDLNEEIERHEREESEKVTHNLIMEFRKELSKLTDKYNSIHNTSDNLDDIETLKELSASFRTLLGNLESCGKQQVINRFSSTITGYIETIPVRIEAIQSNNTRRLEKEANEALTSRVRELKDRLSTLKYSYDRIAVDKNIEEKIEDFKNKVNTLKEDFLNLDSELGSVSELAPSFISECEKLYNKADNTVVRYYEEEKEKQLKIEIEKCLTKLQDISDRASKIKAESDDAIEKLTACIQDAISIDLADDVRVQNKFETLSSEISHKIERANTYKEEQRQRQEQEEINNAVRKQLGDIDKNLESIDIHRDGAPTEVNELRNIFDSIEISKANGIKSLYDTTLNNINKKEREIADYIEHKRIKEQQELEETERSNKLKDVLNRLKDINKNIQNSKTIVELEEIQKLLGQLQKYAGEKPKVDTNGKISEALNKIHDKIKQINRQEKEAKQKEKDELVTRTLRELKELPATHDLALAEKNVENYKMLLDWQVALDYGFDNNARIDKYDESKIRSEINRYLHDCEEEHKKYYKDEVEFIEKASKDISKALSEITQMYNRYSDEVIFEHSEKKITNIENILNKHTYPSEYFVNKAEELFNQFIDDINSLVLSNSRNKDKYFMDKNELMNTFEDAIDNEYEDNELQKPVKYLLNLIRLAASGVGSM